MKQPPPQIEDLLYVVKIHVDERRYRQTIHALQRQHERQIDLLDALYVLKNGYHEKKKTHFDTVNKAWKYAVRGKTLDKQDVRVIIAFDDDGMLIITVMHAIKV